MTENKSLHEIINSPDFVNAPFLHESHLVGTLDVAIARIRNNPAGHFPDPPSKDYTLQVLAAGSGQQTFDIGAGKVTSNARRGAWFVVPPGQAADITVEHNFGVDMFGIPAAVFETAFEALNTSAETSVFQSMDGLTNDTLISQMLRKISDLANTPSEASVLMVDHLFYALVYRILHVTGKSGKPTPSTAPLPEHQFLAVRDFIQDQLDQQIGLTALAALCDLDVYQFSRAFKSRTGTTPYQFLKDARLHRAEEMLTNSQDSIADIAYACGFSSQSHMTATFTKHLGVTPGAYRRELLE
ncbi:MAG: AraC family transcriptional regulator [Pseudomonadota bacterium]